MTTLEKFIPFRKTDLLDMVCAQGALGAPDQDKLRRWFQLTQSIYHFEFLEQLNVLKDAYAPFDPDRDTKSLRQLTEAELKASEERLVKGLQELLTRANYRPIEAADLERAMNEESLFHISLKVDFDDFENHVLFWRGNLSRTVQVANFIGRLREREVPSYERVALLVKFKPADYFKGKKRLAFTPGSMVLKLFGGIPKADLEMLFPNTTVGMTTRDKLIMAVPGVAGGVALLAKSSAAIVTAAGVVAILAKSTVANAEIDLPSSAEMALLVAAGVALGALIGFVFKQWSAYKNRKLAFLKTLTENLYFRNLDNNVGVFHHVLDEAEEEECKEALLAYYFLLTSGAPLTEQALDQRIEQWFAKRYDTHIDFEVDDALRKLRTLNLVQEDAGALRVVDLDEACRRLDERWDNYFQYNRASGA